MPLIAKTYKVYCYYHNFDLFIVHLQKEEKIRVLRQRLVERDVTTKGTELNGASGVCGGTATTSLGIQPPPASIINTTASAHPTPSAALAITQGKQ